MRPALKYSAKLLWNVVKHYAAEFWLHLTKSDVSVIETTRRRESTIHQNYKADSAPMSKNVIHLKRMK